MKKNQKRLKLRTFKWIVGIDEVGRGPLAGPVAVCAFALRFDDVRKNSGKLSKKFSFSSLKLSDSKKLSEKKREEWHTILKDLSKNSKVFYELSYASAKQIDTKGIAVCIRSLIKKNVTTLQKNLQFTHDEVLVLLDGGLKVGEEFLHQETIIKGDEKEPIISFASIIAKVERDALMKRSAKKYPQYFFDIHKGYGTLAHRTAIKQHGHCDLHRKSFLKNILISR